MKIRSFIFRKWVASVYGLEYELPGASCAVRAQRGAEMAAATTDGSYH